MGSLGDCSIFFKFYWALKFYCTVTQAVTFKAENKANVKVLKHCSPLWRCLKKWVSSHRLPLTAFKFTAQSKIMYLFPSDIISPFTVKVQLFWITCLTGYRQDLKVRRVFTLTDSCSWHLDIYWICLPCLCCWSLCIMQYVYLVWKLVTS